MNESPAAKQPPGPAKAPTGVRGLDEVLKDGLLVGRTTPPSGGPGTGKTVLTMKHQALVTPAPVVTQPGAEVRVIGTLSDRRKVRAALRLGTGKS